MTEQSPVEYYHERIHVLNISLFQQQKKRSRLAWARFFSIILAISGTWILWSFHPGIAILFCIISLSAFIFFLKQDLNNNALIANTERLISINELEIRIASHQFSDQPDGLAYKPVLHSYCDDLDIFGRASLFQFINRSYSQQGQSVLAQWLTEPATNPEINERQLAVREISVLTHWRQQLQSYGMNEVINFKTEEKVMRWIGERNQFLHNPFWKTLRILLPVTGISLIALFSMGFIESKQFYPLSLLLLIINFAISKKIIPANHHLSKIAPQLETLSQVIGHIESVSFSSSLLVRIREIFYNASQKASRQIKNLSAILDRFDYRLNPVVFVPLNTFIAWDLLQVFSLEKWKEKNSRFIAEWFTGLARMETIAAISTFSFNHPRYTFPIITTEDAVFIAEEAGHPLIPEGKRVNNSFSTSSSPKINLVTGSNMAGKSTFLRSVGVNTVLALMGAPVAAKSMTVSNMKIMSSMRISDNLEESTSTFYAELKKLKQIIEAVNRGEKIYLLLDEILRGTNSADRHSGSRALIKQLIHHNGAGILATHDLELAKLQSEYPAEIVNYHFDVQVAGEELYFDYKLKPGICRSMNASILMRKIGIELDQV